MHLEWPCAHILDSGGMPWATLPGWLNNNKRFKLIGALYNLSKLMRRLFGIGTAKQWKAMMPVYRLN